MKVINTTTKEIIQLVYPADGRPDSIPDIHSGSSHVNTWNDEHECWEMEQDVVDWWQQYIDDNTEADELRSILVDVLSVYTVSDVIIDGGGPTELEDEGRYRISIYKELAKEHNIELPTK